jgi:hypothetical protein
MERQPLGPTRLTISPARGVRPPGDPGRVDVIRGRLAQQPVCRRVVAYCAQQRYPQAQLGQANGLVSAFAAQHLQPLPGGRSRAGARDFIHLQHEVTRDLPNDHHPVLSDHRPSLGLAARAARPAFPTFLATLP